MSRFKDWKPPVFDAEGWAYKELSSGIYPIEKYGWRCLHHEKLSLGKNIDIGCFAFINAKQGVIIEDEVQIGSGVKIYSSDTIGEREGQVLLKHKCKIVANTVILPGAIIGKNSLVGACSFIGYGKVVGDNEIWVGVPAKLIGMVRDGKRSY